MRERKRTRLTGFDYTTPGGYFVTVAIKDRRCVFGEVVNAKCSLNQFGQIVADQWHWLHDQYAYLVRDEFVVMPNHFHGIVNMVGNGRDRSLQDGGYSSNRPPQQKIKSLSELIGAFKTTSSKRIHRSGLPSFQWQKSFYERIIRNDDELTRIRNYIQTNPVRWDLDIENQKHSSGVGNGRDRSLRSVRDYYDGIVETIGRGVG